MIEAVIRWPDLLITARRFFEKEDVNMDIRTRFDYDKLPNGKSISVRMMVEIKEKEQNTSQRKPLNIGLVLDRSGSMAGQKLFNVKEAAKKFIARLADDDIVSLTAFDHEILTIIAPTAAGKARFLSEQIDQIEPRGTTFLSGGYEQGCNYVAERMNSGCISRVILLTDGLANIGTQDPEALAEIASSLREKGITTTTIGVGSDYDEMLLGKMADKGGGNTFFIEKPSDAVDVFVEEVGYLTSLSATGCTMKFEPAIKKMAFAQLNSYSVLNDGSWLIGDLYSGQKRTLIIEMKIPAIKALGNAELGKLVITYQDAATKDASPVITNHTITTEIISKEAFKDLKPNSDVLCEASLLMMAQAKAEAINLADNHKFNEAATLLENVAGTVEKLHLTNREVSTFVKDLRDLALRFRTEKEEYYTAHNRKRMFHDSDMVLKSQMVSYNSMIERRNRTE